MIHRELVAQLVEHRAVMRGVVSSTSVAPCDFACYLLNPVTRQSYLTVLEKKNRNAMRTGLGFAAFPKRSNTLFFIKHIFAS